MTVIQMRPDLLIVAADHPALEGDVDRFIDELRAEPRYFGPSARTNPKPFPSLLASLRERGGFRLAVIECGRVVGLVRVDGAGEVAIAVAREYRGQGIGTRLGAAALDRAVSLNYRRLVIRSSRRSRAARRVGEALGCFVVDRERGRTDLIVDLTWAERTA